MTNQLEMMNPILLFSISLEVGAYVVYLFNKYIIKVNQTKTNPENTVFINKALSLV